MVRWQQSAVHVRVPLAVPTQRGVLLVTTGFANSTFFRAPYSLRLEMPINKIRCLVYRNVAHSILGHRNITKLLLGLPFTAPTTNARNLLLAFVNSVRRPIYGSCRSKTSLSLFSLCVAPSPPRRFRAKSPVGRLTTHKQLQAFQDQTLQYRGRPL